MTQEGSLWSPALTPFPKKKNTNFVIQKSQNTQEKNLHERDVTDTGKGLECPRTWSNRPNSMRLELLCLKGLKRSENENHMGKTKPYCKIQTWKRAKQNKSKESREVKYIIGRINKPSLKNKKLTGPSAKSFLRKRTRVNAPKFP